MKTSLQFNRACVVVALVFGFAACSADNELQPPKRILDKPSSLDVGTLTGRASDPIAVQKQIADKEE